MRTSRRATPYEAVKKYLYSLKNRGATYGIDRMPPFLRELGNPEKQFPLIHVAGTNGKGSVSALLEACFRAAGYRTGLYTSPHLVRLGERVQVDREVLSDEAITGYVDPLRKAAERLAAEESTLHPTFFEFMTAMAFLHFSSRKVDVGIIEVGLGGRLDATNVVSPLLSVITSIGLDHCEQLGRTLPEVATEKAGIIKPGVPVVLGRLPRDAEDVILSIADDRGSSVHRIVDHFGEDPEQYPRSALPGMFQRINAATAVVAASLLSGSFAISDGAMKAGLDSVAWAGRWQTLQVGGKTLILDATHNEEGSLFLDQNLALLRKKTGRKPVILTGTLGEGRARSLIAVVARHAREIHLVEAAQPRATPFHILESLLPPGFDGPVYRSEVSALFGRPGFCGAGEEGDTIVLTGSIYLIGEVMERLAETPPVHENVLQD